MSKQYSLREQLEAFKRGEWLDERCFYFYDWFCRDTALERKARSLMAKVKKFAKLAELDLDKTYVFFKNNCPMYGSLYDDFRICDVESGDVIYCVTPACGHTSTKNTSNVWGRANKFEKPMFQTNNWRQMLEIIANERVNA